jgi:hypothetical protein
MAPAEMPGLFLSKKFALTRWQGHLPLRTFPTLLPAAKLPPAVVTSPAAEIPATSLPGSAKNKTLDLP